MIAYPDTSFLMALYRRQVNSREAITHYGTFTEPLKVTSLVLFELRQSIRLQQFLHAKNPRLGFDRPTAQAALAKLQANMRSGGIVLAVADWDDVLRISERISGQYTLGEGFRSFDILHVATAIHFGARDFLTFDADQKELAKVEGLKVPL